MLIAENGGTFRMTIGKVTEPGSDRVHVSWTVTQGDGETSLSESETSEASSVEAARRWGHKAARARGFKTIRVKISAALAA
jgi:hypothetical protein